MKKLLLVALCCFPVFLVSCSSNKASDSNTLSNRCGDYKSYISQGEKLENDAKNASGDGEKIELLNKAKESYERGMTAFMCENAGNSEALTNNPTRSKIMRINMALQHWNDPSRENPYK